MGDEISSGFSRLWIALGKTGKNKPWHKFLFATFDPRDLSSDFRRVRNKKKPSYPKGGARGDRTLTPFWGNKF